MMSVQQKKGGPYTTQENEKRQEQVHILHIECGYSAVKIAKKLNAKRNTINADIKDLYSNLKEDWKEYDPGSLLIKQIQRMENQRSNYYEELKKCKSSDARKYWYNKIDEIDEKITKIIIKVVPNERKTESTISNGIVTDVIKHLLKNGVKVNFEIDEIVLEIIKYQKCDLREANLIIDKMQRMGLSLCLKSGVGAKMPQFYNLAQFSELRGI